MFKRCVTALLCLVALSVLGDTPGPSVNNAPIIFGTHSGVSATKLLTVDLCFLDGTCQSTAGGGGGGTWGSITGTLSNQTDLNAVLTETSNSYLTTLPSLSLPYSQLTGTPTDAFPGSSTSPQILTNQGGVLSGFGSYNATGSPLGGTAYVDLFGNGNAEIDDGGSANFSASVTAASVTSNTVLYTSDGYNSLIITPTGTDIAIGNGVTAPDNSGGVAVGYYSNGSSYGAAVGDGSDGDSSGAAVGYGSNGSSSGVGVGIFSDGDSSGVAVGEDSGGFSGGAAVGAYSNGSNSGAAVGYGSNGSDSGVAVGNNSYGYNGGVAVGYGSNTNNINGAVAIGGDANDIYPATIPGGFTLPTVQLGRGTAVLDGGLNFGTGGTVYPVMDVNGIFQVTVQAPGVTPTSTTAGSIAFTSAYLLCVYNGSGWVHAATGATSCVF